jgi:phosphoserine aminotransferase
MDAFEKPDDDRFSSGPTRKIPNWSKNRINEMLLGRQHRGTTGLSAVRQMLALLRDTLAIPDTHKVALVNGGATGATEFAMWNLLGERPVDVFSYGIFGDHWSHDVLNELKIRPVRNFCAPIGMLPDFWRYNPKHDCVFVLHDTPSGVFVPNVDWIPINRDGVVVCDVTSSVFCNDIPWTRLDAASFSFQKGIGGEGGLGAVVLTSNAIDRLKNYAPKHPIPRLYRGAVEGERSINEDFFTGHVANTISLLTVNDMILSLEWAQKRGGLMNLIQRVENLYRVVRDWVARTPWVDFLVSDETIRAKNSVCLTILKDGRIATWEFLRKMTTFLETNGIEAGILNYVHDRPSLRIWLGPVVEELDVIRLLLWIEKAFYSCGGNWCDCGMFLE